MTTWIQTFSGRQFWPLAPRVQDVAIEDIAHALSNVCRFTGHCRQFYSVAQHSVLVSTQVPLFLAMPALLHDASEAYIADLARPVKRGIDRYGEIEAALEAVVEQAFGIPNGRIRHTEIKKADLRALATERRDLMAPPPAPWVVCEDVRPFGPRIIPMYPVEAKQIFLARFSELGGAL